MSVRNKVLLLIGLADARRAEIIGDSTYHALMYDIIDNW